MSSHLCSASLRKERSSDDHHRDHRSAGAAGARARSVAYVNGMIRRYEHNLQATDTRTDLGIAHRAVLELTIADWRHRLEAMTDAA